MSCIEGIKYLDMFGTSCKFYTEKHPLLYILLCDLLSLTSIVVCLSVFLVFSKDEFHLNNPITTTSSIISDCYKKIKFCREKIWIPFRIVDGLNITFNFKNIFFPLITYKVGGKQSNLNNKNNNNKINININNNISYKKTNFNIDLNLTNNDNKNNNNNGILVFESKSPKYITCNETSMSNLKSKDLNGLEVILDSLYYINMEYLDMGGS